MVNVNHKNIDGKCDLVYGLPSLYLEPWQGKCLTFFSSFLPARNLGICRKNAYRTPHRMLMIFNVDICCTVASIGINVESLDDDRSVDSGYSQSLSKTFTHRSLSGDRHHFTGISYHHETPHQPSACSTPTTSNAQSFVSGELLREDIKRFYGSLPLNELRISYTRPQCYTFNSSK
jgi:hypothetical protein